MPRFKPHQSTEKSENFKESITRLIKNLNPWKKTMIIALALAMLSAILALITPDKLSEFADTIGEGLVPKTEVLEKINVKITKNLTDQEKIKKLFINQNISKEDLNKTKEIFIKLEKTNKEESLKLLLTLPNEVLNYLLEDITINNKKIPVKDQIAMLNLYSNMNKNIQQEEALKIFDKLPKSIYNVVKPTINMQKIKELTIFMACLYLLSAIFNYIQSFSLTTVSNKFAYRLRSNISRKINKLPLKYFDTHETGDVLSRVTNDVDTVAMNLNNSLATLVTSITLFIGSIIMMFITNWIMALTAIISSLLGFILMSTILKSSQKYFEEKQKELGNINGFIEEMYSGHEIVKAYNGTAESLKKFEQLNHKLYEANRKSQFLSGMMHPLMGFIGNFGYVAVCIVGALLTMNNIISFGVIVAFMIYVRMFTNPLTQIAQAMTSLQATAAASERVFNFLDEQEMTLQDNIKNRLSISNAKGNIEFKNVKFGYKPGQSIIKDFSVKVKPGQKIAIVGPTGAGKTTLVNLLMKFYEINKGEILIDGIPLSNLTRENVHDLFIMVLQDTWLFEGTIGENVKFNNENISERQIWEALKTVGVDHFVKTLPGGLDYQISDNDVISQGQKQLLTIARGMIEDSPFLILDEATSNVDTRTEELVQKAMDKLMEGRTSFIIAHRLSTIKNADLILVMNEGDIIEQGSHEELLKKDGFYKKLYNSQFELTEE